MEWPIVHWVHGFAIACNEFCRIRHVQWLTWKFLIQTLTKHSCFPVLGVK